MCGRFQLSVKGKQISERFNVEVFDEMYKPSYNCAPSQKLGVISNLEQGKLNFFRWGLIPFWAKNPSIAYKLINTRSETILEKSTLKTAFLKRRCLIPANGFYEWRTTDKIPYRIFMKNEEIFALAGIWETWKDAEGRPINTFSIITTTPNSIMQSLHDRMPVILNRENESDWLNEKNEKSLYELLKPFSSQKMEVYPISTKINSAANNGKELIIPVIDNQQSKLF